MARFLIIERRLAAATKRNERARAADFARELSEAFDGLDAMEVRRLIARRDGGGLL